MESLEIKFGLLNWFHIDCHKALLTLLDLKSNLLIGLNALYICKTGTVNKYVIAVF